MPPWHEPSTHEPSTDWNPMFNNAYMMDLLLYVICVPSIVMMIEMVNERVFKSKRYRVLSNLRIFYLSVFGGAIWAAFAQWNEGSYSFKGYAAMGFVVLAVTYLSLNAFNRWRNRRHDKKVALEAATVGDNNEETAPGNEQ